MRFKNVTGERAALMAHKGQVLQIKVKRHGDGVIKGLIKSL